MSKTVKIENMPDGIDTRICGLCYCNIDGDCLADWSPNNCGMQKISYEEHIKVIGKWQRR